MRIDDEDDEDMNENEKDSDDDSPHSERNDIVLNADLPFEWKEIEEEDSEIAGKPRVYKL